MRAPSLLAPLLALLALPAPARAEDLIELSDALSAVTVYGNEANLTRSAELTLEAGTWRLGFDALPQDALGYSLGATATSGRVELVELVPSWSPPPEDEAAALQDELLRVEARRALLLEQYQLLVAEADQLIAVQRSPTRAEGEAGADLLAAAADTPTRSWIQQRLGALAAAAEAQRVEARSLRARSEELGRQLRPPRSGRSDRPVVTLSLSERSTVTVNTTVRVEGPGWVPSYDLQLDPAAGSALISLHALVAQEGGADWEQVQLSCSTASPSAAADLPELSAWYLEEQAPEPEPMEEEFGRLAQERRMQTGDQLREIARELDDEDVMDVAGSTATTRRGRAAGAGGSMADASRAERERAVAAAIEQARRQAEAAQQQRQAEEARARVMEAQRQAERDERRRVEEEYRRAMEQAGGGDDGERGWAAPLDLHDPWPAEGGPILALLGPPPDGRTLIEVPSTPSSGRPLRAGWSELHPAVNARGFDFAWQVEGPVVVPGDGTPRRIPLATLTPAARFEHRVSAVVEEAAFLTAVLTPDGSRPLLPGNAQIFDRGELLGVTQLAGRAPGEELALGLGPDPQVRVERTLEEVADRSGAVGGERVERTITIRLQNLRAEAIEVLLDDRIPTSEQQGVRVRSGTFSHPPEQREDGRLQWRLPIAAGETVEVRFDYEIQHPRNTALVAG